LIELFARSIKSGTPYESEQRLRRWDGVYRWFQARAFPQCDASGQVVRWCLLLTDIDERKRAEDALRASERNLQLIIDTLPALIWSARADGSAEFFSRHYLDYTGLSAEQARGWNWTSAVHPDDLESLGTAWQSILASAAPGEAEARLRRFDGSYRWFLFRANPLRDESGNIVRWYGANLDIDDRKHGEEALHEREVSWRQIVDNIPGFVVTMGPLGEVEFLNRQTLEYFGKTTEELKDWALIDVVHSDDLPRIVEARKESIEGGRIYDVEHRCQGADGVFRWFHVRGLPVRNAEGAITTWYLLLTDIDERKRAEQALEQTQSYLSEGQRVAHMGSWAFNAGGFDYWSPELFRIHGLDPRGEPPTVAEYLDLVHPEDREFMQYGIQKMLTESLGFDFTKRIIGANGEIRHIRCVGVPVVDGATFKDFVGTGIDVTEQERLLHKLRQSERDLRTITDTIRHIIVVLAPDGTTLYANQVAFDFTGLAAGEVESEGFVARACHPEDLDQVHGRRRIGLLEGVPFEMEMRALFKRTQYRWVLMQYNPLRDEQGKIFRWYVTATDIEERKRAEEALQTSERNLSLLINAIPTHIYVLNTEGSVQYVNQAIVDYTGLTLEDVQQADYRDRVIHPEDFIRVRAGRAASLRCAAPFSTEQRVLGKDGRYRWFLVRYNPWLEEEGRIVRWYVAAFDIEDRKLAEAQVEQAYLRLAEAQQLSKTGSFITDLVADDHNWSEEAFRIFEFDPAAKVSVQMIRDIVHPEDLPSFDVVIARGMTGTDVDFVFRIVTSGGTIKHIRGMARLLTQIEGRPLFIGALQDITESKVAAEALDTARSELAHVSRVTTLNALTGSIAHEINQPLSGIITNAGTCLRMLDVDPPNIDGARETARRTLRDGKRAADVITRLRVLFSKKEFTLEPLDLNEATREVIALSVSDLQRNRVTLLSELTDCLPPVVGDRVQLQQVILNLLRNASDAMVGVDDRPRDLLIRTLPDGEDYVCLSVQDSGIGIHTQDQKRLFDAFYTTKIGGMGIGLSVSRSIIERHHGRLWAEANLGPGATFSFSVPCRHKTVTNVAPS
jgi:PAS domain S-box-containing protein